MYSTPYSEKSITLEDYQYIELTTRKTLTETASYLKISMFVSKADWEKLDTIIDTSDDQVM